MSKQAYLAEKYMSGVKAEAILSRVGTKKKKRKQNPSSSVTASGMIKDEDAGWGDEGREEAEDIEDAVVEKDRGFKKRRLATAEEGSGWATIQDGLKAETPPPADEQPLIVGGDVADLQITGGLLTTKQLRNALPKVQPIAEVSREEMEAAQETIYRDPSGRKIDTKAERAEAARRKREKEEKEAQKMEWGKGLVQREDQEKRRLELEKQKTRGFARYADDKDLNEELKAQDRWNDPAVAFLTVSTGFLGRLIIFLSFRFRKRPRRDHGNQSIVDLRLHQTVLGSSQDTDGMASVRIKTKLCVPDGADEFSTDRSNGFEKKFFQKSNERSRNKQESYQWRSEDM
jgi:pre-mRNA-splicing factor CWC26